MLASIGGISPPASRDGSVCMFTIDLGGKTALVTGGSQGLGLVTAQTLHQAGANVAIGFFPDDAGENRARAERAVASLGDTAMAIAADVPKVIQDKGLKAGDWVRAAAEACGGKGGGRPDFAQAGGKEPARLPEALRAAKAFAGARIGE
jgi:NAD(P)-dependent dehydrogenase (short-subunit alcohol dehydrogenase family)